MNDTPKNLAGFIWQVADLLRGDYKQSEYGRVILPFTVLRRLECVLEPTRKAVRAEHQRLFGQHMDLTPFLCRQSGYDFYNTTPHTLTSIAGAPDDMVVNLNKYVNGFSENVGEAFDKYRFREQVVKLDEAKLLYNVVTKFADTDLHPDVVSNHEMGYAFEELIRKFSEDSNETAGEHFTPREIIRLMAGLLIAPDLDDVKEPGASRTIYDPACGTGGMLTAAEDFLRANNATAKVYVFGQEVNPESWAICRSDMVIKGQKATRIALGNSFSDDRYPLLDFDYLMSNPPFGVDWKKVKKFIEDERDDPHGRFGAGTPRVNDGSLLFLQHMISKMKPPSKGGSRLAIVFNGSPLFTGAAGSGESEIRRWILEKDWLEAIVALPDQLFYNTGISTYFWILTNRKAPDHRGKVILLDAREYWAKMRKSLGEKRKMITEDQIRDIMRLYAEALVAAEDSEHEYHKKVKIFANHEFGYQRITVERPLKLRFEVTPEALTELETTLKAGRATSRYEERDELLAALRALTEREPDFRKADFQKALRVACAERGLAELPGPVDKAVWAAVSARDPEGEVQRTRHGDPEADSELRDNENVPLGEDVGEYLRREVLPHVPDAWIDEGKTKVGYEIPFTRHFYEYKPPRPLEEIDAELKALESQIQTLLREVTQ